MRTLTPLLFFYSLFVSFFIESAILGDSDEREQAPDAVLSFVGTIFCDGGVRGTGAHIKHPLISDNNSPYIIVTAAHVLFQPNTSKIFEACAYRPKGNRLSAINFEKISPFEYRPLSQTKLEQASTDLVFISLKSKPRGTAITLKERHTNSDLRLVGYNQNQDNISMSGKCSSFSSSSFPSEKLLLHNCDGGSGSSGGPILDQKTNSISGIHGGTLFIKNGSNVSGTPRSNLMPDAESFINQGRRVDSDVLAKLRDFILSLTKDSQN